VVREDLNGRSPQIMDLDIGFELAEQFPGIRSVRAPGDQPNTSGAGRTGTLVLPMRLSAWRVSPIDHLSRSVSAIRRATSSEGGHRARSLASASCCDSPSLRKTAWFALISIDRSPQTTSRWYTLDAWSL